VKRPLLLTVPPVALQVTVGLLWVEPLLSRAEAANCWLAPAATVAEAGVTVIEEIDELLMVTLLVSARPLEEVAIMRKLP
jgi:hypothetical protein